MSIPERDRKLRAAELIARGVPAEAVGKNIGVTGRTVRRWVKEPAFAEQVAEMRQVSMRETVRALEAASRLAVAALLRNIREDADPRVQISASRALLSSLGPVSEHAELRDRVAALEAAEEARDSSSLTSK